MHRPSPSTQPNIALTERVLSDNIILSCHPVSQISSCHAEFHRRECWRHKHVLSIKKWTDGYSGKLRVMFPWAVIIPCIQRTLPKVTKQEWICIMCKHNMQTPLSVNCQSHQYMAQSPFGDCLKACCGQNGKFLSYRDNINSGKKKSLVCHNLHF